MPGTAPGPGRETVVLSPFSNSIRGKFNHGLTVKLKLQRDEGSQMKSHSCLKQVSD
jgi:hypothetical protein